LITILQKVFTPDLFGLSFADLAGGSLCSKQAPAHALHNTQHLLNCLPAGPLCLALRCLAPICNTTARRASTCKYSLWPKRCWHSGLEITVAAVHGPQMPLATRFKPSISTIYQHHHVCLATKALLALGTLKITLAAVHGPPMLLAGNNIQTIDINNISAPS